MDILQDNPYKDKIKSALKEGYSIDEINSFLKEKRGVENPDQYTRQAISASVQEAKSQGYSDEEIAQHLTTQRNIPKEYLDSLQVANTQADTGGQFTVPEDNKVTMDATEMQQQKELAAAALSDDYKSIYAKYSTLGKQIQGIYNPTKRAEAEQDIATLNKLVVDKLNENGFDTQVDPDTGDIVMRDSDGTYKPVDSSMLNDMINHKYEYGGAVAGGILGAKAPGPWQVKLFASILGSAGGAMAGRGLDVVAQAAKLKEDLQAGFVWEQMKDAGAADAIMNVVGQPIAKLGLAGVRATKRAYDFVMGGNVEGAYKMLKETMFITDEEAKNIVTKWEKLNQAELPGNNLQEKALAGTVLTKPGGEGILKAATSLDSKASSVVANQISLRAQQLLDTTKKLSFDRPATEFVQALDNYTDDVMTYFSKIKDIGVKQVPDTYYYDVNKLGLNKIEEVASKNIDGLDARERLTSLLTKIRDTTEKDDFESLLELRKIVNNFKYNKRLVSPADFDAVNSVLKGIDTEINNVAHRVMPDGTEWLKHWKKAKSEYAKMQKVKDNELVKALGIKFRKDPGGNFERVTAKKLDDKKLVSTLTKTIGAVDNTFDEVMSKLPKKVQGRVEGQVLNDLVDKYTAGAEGELRATHFPELAKHLSGIKFRSSKAKQLKRTIIKMAEVYRNDPNLARVSGSISLPRFQSYLTTDPVVRAKFEIASNVFNYVKRLMPGNTANTLSLVENVGKLLENPLNQKEVTAYLKNLPKDERFKQEKLVRTLQRAVFQYDKLLYRDQYLRSTKTDRLDDLTKIEIGKPYSLKEPMSTTTDLNYLHSFELANEGVPKQGRFKFKLSGDITNNQPLPGHSLDDGEVVIPKGTVIEKISEDTFVIKEQPQSLGVATMDDAMNLLGVDTLTYKEAQSPEVLNKLREAGYDKFLSGDKEISLLEEFKDKPKSNLVGEKPLGQIPSKETRLAAAKALRAYKMSGNIHKLKELNRQQRQELTDYFFSRDEKKAKGLTTNQTAANVDYFGTTIRMKPKNFLLSALSREGKLYNDSISRDFAQAIIDEMLAAKKPKLGPPKLWLDIQGDKVVVTGHEGRHRTDAIRALLGEDVSIPVDLQFTKEGAEYRASNLTGEELNLPVVNEEGKPLGLTLGQM